jgi:Family of unknown function (DUF6152)
MKRALSVVLFAIFSFAGLALPVFAHHGFQAEFDGQKLVYVTGTLMKLEWENPHIYFYVESKDADGKVTSWQFEGDSPNVVKRAGTQRQDILAYVGKTITVRACPGKDGSPKGAAETLKGSDGRELVVGGRRFVGGEKPGDKL